MNDSPIESLGSFTGRIHVKCVACDKLGKDGRCHPQSGYNYINKN